MLVKYALSLDEKGQNLSTNDRILSESEKNEVFTCRLLCKCVQSVVIGFLVQLKSKAALNFIS